MNSKRGMVSLGKYPKHATHPTQQISDAGGFFLQDRGLVTEAKKRRNEHTWFAMPDETPRPFSPFAPKQTKPRELNSLPYRLSRLLLWLKHIRGSACFRPTYLAYRHNSHGRSPYFVNMA